MKKVWCASASGIAIACAALAAPAHAQQAAAVVLPDVVIAASPVPGTPQVDINKIPDNVSVVSAKDFEQRFSPSVADAITSHVAGAIALNVDGSDLSPDLFIRGYDASRITGTPIGLAVYQNGVRINERFGDNVNLDLIPPIAIADADVYTANPIFGLNALGGAINFITKNGFTFHGGDAMLYGGSFGRVNGNLEYGKQSGNWAFYFAGDLYRDGGYRPFGAQNAERFLADLGYRAQDSEAHLIANFGRSLLGVQGVTPQVLVNQQYNSVFTSPQTTNNQAGSVQGTLRVDLSKTWTSNTSMYIRQFDQYHVDGNDADVTDCSEIDGANAGTLCLSPGDVGPGFQTSQALQFIHNGAPIPSMGPNNTDTFPYGTTARTATHTTSAGLQEQLTNKQTIYGHDNYFAVGASIDASTTHFSSTTTLGQLNSAFQNLEYGIPGAGNQLNTAGAVGFNSVFLASTREDYGVFVVDTFNVTKQLAITAGARFNLSNIGTRDLSGLDPGDNAKNSYERINPTVGATYEFAKPFTVFGNYAETNRAPTPLETNCANPNQPCLLETALVSDPPLQQVVARTVEAGARGIMKIPYGATGEYGTLSYKADYFHSAASNDIVSLPSPISGQGYFANVPETLRQGAEVEVAYNKGALTFYGNYAYVDATYQFAGQLSSPNNPNPTVIANGGLENVVPGNHIPGIPRNIGKLGFEYKITPRLTFGMDTVIVGSQYFVGDDSNLNPQLPAYYFVNLHASYQVTDHVQVFGFVNNVTNNHYSTYGAYYDTGTDGGNINATLAANNPANGGPGNANSVTVAQPLSVYGGVKIKF